MKFKIKALVAATAMVMASGANAALIHGGNAFEGDGTGELFLSVVARDGTNEKRSYIRDLNIDANGWTSGSQVPAANQVVAAHDSIMDEFLADAAANGWTVAFNVAGNANGYDGNVDQTNFHDNGFFITSQSDLVNNLDPAYGPSILTYVSTSGNLGGQISAINLNSGGADSFSTSVVAPKLHDSATWGGFGSDYPMSPFIGHTERGLDTASNFYQIGYFYNDLTDIETASGTLLGSWTLASSGDLIWNAGSVSQVPLPPAVWLLSSALIGLAGVTRRRQAKVTV